MSVIKATITLQGPPISKQRHRSFMMGKNRIRTYDPQADLKKSISMEMRRQLKICFKDVNIFKVSLEFLLPLPKTLSTSKRNMALWTHEHPCKKDIDNLEKFYLDCGNGVLWHDDSMITSIRSKKRYSETPKTIIKIIGVKNMERKPVCDAILKEFSPFEFLKLLKDFEYVKDKISKLEDFRNDPKTHSKDAACVILYFASKYAKKLNKISKEYAHYHEKLDTFENVEVFMEEDHASQEG